MSNINQTSGSPVNTEHVRSQARATAGIHEVRPLIQPRVEHFTGFGLNWSLVPSAKPENITLMRDGSKPPSTSQHRF